MKLKQTLKSIRPIRLLGKRINIRSQFRQDTKDFTKYYVEKAIDRKDFRYSIMLIVHSLEKGMCFSNPRPFGKDKVKELMNLLKKYPESKKNDFEYELGISILFAWIKYYESHDWIEEIEYVTVKEYLKDKKNNPDIVAGWQEYRKPKIDLNACEDLLLSRHSVRDFKEDKIRTEDIQFALRCFVETPTACNRQMCRVYYVSNPSVIDLFNRVIVGISGFNKKTVQFFVITYDLAAFAYSGERQQGMFNAGLCTMNFINGLHARGIGSCCLQWSNKLKEDKEVRKKLGLLESERIGIIIGAGYYLDNNIIPCSARRKTEDIFNVI